MSRLQSAHCIVLVSVLAMLLMPTAHATRAVPVSKTSEAYEFSDFFSGEDFEPQWKASSYHGLSYHPNTPPPPYTNHWRVTTDSQILLFPAWNACSSVEAAESAGPWIECVCIDSASISMASLEATSPAAWPPMPSATA